MHTDFEQQSNKDAKAKTADFADGRRFFNHEIAEKREILNRRKQRERRRQRHRPPF